MYRNDSILELLDIFSAKTGRGTRCTRRFPVQSGSIGDTGTRMACAPRSIRYRRRPLLGRFLEEYFVDGFSALPELARQAHRSRIILPSHDRCFPVERDPRLRERHGIPATTLPEAHDHFFVGAWPRVWGSSPKRLICTPDKAIFFGKKIYISADLPAYYRT
jgi:hypothetical protein